MSSPRPIPGVSSRFPGGIDFICGGFKDNPKRFWIARQPFGEVETGAYGRRLQERLLPTLSRIEAGKNRPLDLARVEWVLPLRQCETECF